MANPDKNLEDKIQSVRKQIAALDSKRDVLSSVLEKLERQKTDLTGEKPYQQKELAAKSIKEDKNKKYSSSIKLSSESIPCKPSINDKDCLKYP